MPACPLCEHVQDLGDACEVCGRRLLGGAGGPVVVTPLEGLEATAREAVGVAAQAPVEGLEPTRLAGADVVVTAGEGAAWVEDTAFAAVEVVAEALEVERIERGEALPELDPFEAPTCRYCRTTGMPGDVFCQGCGMRISALAPRTAEPEVVALRCPECGRAGAGPSCRACGARLGSSH